jgi:hypothetical protein
MGCILSNFKLPLIVNHRRKSMDCQRCLIVIGLSTCICASYFRNPTYESSNDFSQDQKDASSSLPGTFQTLVNSVSGATGPTGTSFVVGHDSHLIEYKTNEAEVDLKYSDPDINHSRYNCGIPLIVT